MKVLCVSGSRADYGGVEAVYKALVKRNIPADLYGADALWKGYDLVVLYGDRSEVLRVAVDYFLMKVPIAHLAGGDITSGSQDDSMRHAITKLSHLHFASCQESADRIIKMGEDPSRVHVVGYTGVDSLEVSEHPPLWLTDRLGEYHFILVVWHPNTLVDEYRALEEVKILTEALDHINSNFVVIGPNSDAGSERIRDHLKWWCNLEDNDYHDNLPRSEYLWLLKQAKCLVGNSSSGFYEAPSFGTPVVNIGDRQKGRVVHSMMVSAAIDADDIVESINIARILPRVPENIYRTGNAADRVASVIAGIKDPEALLRKVFYE